MKALKILVGILITIVVLIAIAVGLALTPAVQTWAVRKATANQPGLTLDVQHVAVGLSGADLDRVHVVKDGMIINADHVSSKYTAWDFISHRKINVDDLTVDGLVVDLSHPAAAPASEHAGTETPASGKATSTKSSNPTAEPAQPFNGILNQIQIPYDVRIARFSVPGRAILPNDQTVTFELHGSDIGTGQRGTVDWKIDMANGAPNAPFTALHSTGTANLHITTERRIDLADVNTAASIEGPKLPSDQVKLVAKAEQPAAGGNEGYNANVFLVHGENTQQLLTLAAQYDTAKHAISGAWTLTVQREQVSALLNGLGLPDLAANGAGKFTLNPSTNAVTADGELQTDLSQLQKISPELQPIGSLHLRTNFAGGFADNVARLDHLDVDATTANGRQLAQINALQKIAFSTQDKRVSVADPNADLLHVAVQDLPLAWAQPFLKGMTVESGSLSLALAVSGQADGSQVRVTALQPVTLRDATIVNSEHKDQKVTDRLTVTVKPQAEYANDRLQAQLTDLEATMPTGDSVSGKFTVDITHASKPTRSIAFTADTQAKVITALKPYLPANEGPMTVVSNSQGTMAGTLLKFDRSSATVTRSTGQQILTFELQQPLSIDTKSNTFSTPKPDTTTARVQVANVPLAWAGAVVKGGTFAGELVGGTLDVTLRSITDVAATTTAPIVLRGVSVTMNNQAMLQNVDLAADFTGAKKDDAVTYDVRSVQVKQGPTQLAKLVLKGRASLGKKLAVAAKGTLEADAAALLAQPIVASYASLSRGTVDVTFDANVADTIQANTTVIARNLVAKQGNRPLGDAELTLTATVQADGSSIVKVPFTLTNGSRKSDLMIDGKLAQANNRVTFDGKITSNLLVVDDLQPLAALAPASQPPTKAPNAPQTAPRNPTVRPSVPVVSSAGAPSAPATSTTARDTQPFWNAFGGKVTVDLKRITYGPDYVISDVQGAATITSAQLALSSLTGKFNDNPFKLGATVAFDEKQPKPYAMQAMANFANVDIGAILKAANPNDPPQLETTVTVTADIHGNGGTINDLAQQAYGKFDVSGSKGVLRALGKKGGGAVSIASTALGLLGAVRGSDTTVALADLAKKLDQLPFDRFGMHVERGADLNLNISSIEFVSPDTKVTGSGQITNQPGVPIQNQPLEVTLTIAGKDEMAYLLNKAHMLGGQQDGDGYYEMSSKFTLKGTPAKPDSSDLWKILGQAAIGGFLGG